MCICIYVAVSGNPQSKVVLKLSTITLVFCKDIFQYTREIISVNNLCRAGKLRRSHKGACPAIFPRAAHLSADLSVVNPAELPDKLFLCFVKLSSFGERVMLPSIRKINAYVAAGAKSVVSNKKSGHTRSPITVTVLRRGVWPMGVWVAILLIMVLHTLPAWRASADVSPPRSSP